MPIMEPEGSIPCSCSQEHISTHYRYNHKALHLPPQKFRHTMNFISLFDLPSVISSYENYNYRALGKCVKLILSPSLSSFLTLYSLLVSFLPQLPREVQHLRTQSPGTTELHVKANTLRHITHLHCIFHMSSTCSTLSSVS